MSHCYKKSNSPFGFVFAQLNWFNRLKTIANMSLIFQNVWKNPALLCIHRELQRHLLKNVLIIVHSMWGFSRKGVLDETFTFLNTSMMTLNFSILKWWVKCCTHKKLLVLHFKWQIIKNENLAVSDIIIDVSSPEIATVRIRVCVYTIYGIQLFLKKFAIIFECLSSYLGH